MRINPRSVFGRAVAVATASVIMLPATAYAASPGAPGIGDPYFPDYGNGGYDASHYDVAIDVDGSIITGTTTMTATATQDLSRFNLDFVLKTTKVTVNGQAATFTHDVIHELVITPAKNIPKGEMMTVVVSYSDNPALVRDRGINPVYATNPGLAIVGEPESAPWWMATNDHPRDKATYNLTITADSALSVATAGVLKSKKKDGAKTTWNWQVKQPSTGYLIPLVVGSFDVVKSKVDGRPSWDAIANDLGTAGDAAKADFKRLGEVINTLEEQFGKYPFDSHGGIVPKASLGFALETQNRPTYSPQFWSGGRSNVGVIVHENGHEWFGDSVSVHNWRDIWLNEGFASWSEWYWQEAQGGSTAAQILMATYNRYGEGDSLWTIPIGDPGASRVFSGAVYTRGAMAVQALRNRIGEQDMTTLFKKWQKKHKHDDSSIKKFHKLAEKISGEDLDGFFKNWLYTPSKPAATKENGLAGFAGAEAIANITTADVPEWEQLRANADMIAAAEQAAHR